MDNRDRKGKQSKTARFLLGSFALLLLISVGAFLCLGSYMNRVSKQAIDEVGDLYMTGINEQITAHFRTIMVLKLEQAETAVEVVSAGLGDEDRDELYEELIYRVKVRNFDYLALSSGDGELEMLWGSQLHLADPEPFFTSLRRGEKKVAVGRDEEGNEVVLFGVGASYPMKNGESCIAMVTAMPIDYISSMLSPASENTLMYSHIIRQDGSFVISGSENGHTDYFSSLYERYGATDEKEVGRYISELSQAMEKGQDYVTIQEFGNSRQQVYCTLLPYSEWHLVTVLPFGILNETVEGLNVKRTAATMLACSIILAILLAIFFVYFRMSRRQMRELEEARQEAMDATKAKSEFLSNMSHDIRTPMNAIVGMTAIAAAHINDTDQVQNCLKKIALSGKHLLGLINDVLDMSKIESGKMTLTAERVSLREVVEGIVGIVQTQARSKGQSFNVQIGNILSEDVYCDSVRLNQVLLNLLSNAVKYTPEGGMIQLSIDEEPAPKEKGPGYVRTHIRVKDNGIGMTPEFLEKIFDSYSRADSKRVQKTEGAGLGMAITKYIVGAMDGTITVESELGKGSEFHVTLDLERAEEQNVDMVLPPWKMLVVDDDEVLCRTASDALTEIGLHAEWTLSGETALEMIEKRHKARDDYQIVLLDWKLPGMDGLAVARQIRRMVGEDMPVILISAYDWSDFEDEAREAGISGFISKPLFKSTLFYGLRRYMEGEDAAGEDQGRDAGEDKRDLEGKRILVAEDNDLNWEILNELLSDGGMLLEWAENGQVCLEKFKASQPGYYDAILMDIRMPVMNGYEATEAIRGLARSDAATVPIIAMTADAFSEDIQRCLKCGMNAHAAKPVNLEELYALLRKFM